MTFIPTPGAGYILLGFIAFVGLVCAYTRSLIAETNKFFVSDEYARYFYRHEDECKKFDLPAPAPGEVPGIINDIMKDGK